MTVTKHRLAIADAVLSGFALVVFFVDLVRFAVTGTVDPLVSACALIVTVLVSLNHFADSLGRLR